MSKDNKNNNTFSLTDSELKQFRDQGWIGPFKLLSESEAAQLVPELERCHAKTRGMFYPEKIEPGKSYYKNTPWFQSLHALSPTISEIAQRPEIVDRVAQLMGDDLLLWGAIKFSQAANKGYHWHTDTEFDFADGISIWLAVEGVTPDNALKIIPRSDNFKPMPEEYIGSGKYSMEDFSSDKLALSLARESDPGANIVRPPVRDSEFFIFRGKLWHGSDNNTDKTRHAMGLRYSSTSQSLRIPLTYLQPMQWDPALPPCVLVRGKDDYGNNNIIEMPKVK